MSGREAEVERLRRNVSELKAEVERLRRDVEALKVKPDTEAAVLDMDGAAGLLKVHKRTVRRRIKDSRIPHVRLAGNRGVRFVRADLIKWLRDGCPRQGTSRLHSKRHAPGRPAARGDAGAKSS